MDIQDRRYLYVNHTPLLPKFLGVFGLLSAIMMTIGFIRFFDLDWRYLLIWGIPALFIIGNRIARYITYLFSPVFDKEKHIEFLADFWKKNSQQPSVDVFVPCAGEDEQLIKKTLDGVKGIDYKNIKVYILDDKGSEELKKIVQSFNFNYLSRPNLGEFKKAGNLQYGYDHTNGEFVLVLDADFVPSKEILKETIPYLVTQEKIGILQTPQFFNTSEEVHTRSAIEFGGGNVVEDFYRFDMPGRDRVGGAMCVGTSAIYRRKAIIESGGPPKVWGTEDVRQGLKIMKFGWTVRYLPIILSQGLSPDTMEGYFKQHSRWCTGSIETVFGQYFREARLTPLGRVVFFVNLTFYISNALSVILAFHVLALLFAHYDTLSWSNVIWFIPQLLLSFVFPYFYRISRPRYGTFLAAITQIFTYLYTIPQLITRKLRGKEAEWVAANTRESKIARSFMRMALMATIFYSLYLFSFAFIRFVSPNNFFDLNKTGLLIFWLLYSAIIWGLFIISIIRESFSKLMANYRKDLISPVYLYKYTVAISIMLVLAVLSVIVSFVINVIQTNYYITPRGKDTDILSFQRDLQHQYFGENVINESAPLGRIDEGVSTAESSVKNDIASVGTTPVSASVNSGGVIAIIPNPQPEPAPTTALTQTQYEYTVEKGGSLTKYVRQAVNTYLLDNSIKFDKGQRLFIESAVLSTRNFAGVTIGQKITLTFAEIRIEVDKAYNMSMYYRNYWNNYASNIGFV